ncbi:MAG: MurR/RpiR family transcriptional regulator, partial [Deltaproteobacteria bacterium]|nr:MurR/RpiR family transcriptional regulator [Deltaproteobacteria bacterium]
INLASKAGVSEATVSRLAHACGYSGYAELQSAIQVEVKDNLSLRRHVPQAGQQSLLAEIAYMEKTIMDDMISGISDELFEKTVDLLYEAKRLIVVGSQCTYPLAYYAVYFFRTFRSDVELVSCQESHILSLTQKTGPETVVLSYSFPRYPRMVQELVADFHKAGHYIIGVTDSPLSPLAEFTKHILAVPTTYASLIDPFAGVLVLTHALLMATMLRDKQNYARNIARFNDFVVNKKIYLNSEIDIVNLVDI